MSKTDQLITPDASSLAKDIGKASGKGPPPVHLWNPPFSGDIDMRIARDGTWFYLGTPINRPELVRLFASILRKDGDDFFLVTPVEKVGIRVEDAPFVAIDFDVTGEGDNTVITFETNVGDFVEVNPENPIRVVSDPVTDEPAPYVHVRRGLEALIDRKSFYRLAEIGVKSGTDYVVRSSGVEFPIGSADEP